MQRNFVFAFFVNGPIIELRGAIPSVLDGVSLLGCLSGVRYRQSVAVPFLIPFAGRVLRWGATLPRIGGLFQKILDIGNKKVKKTQSTNHALLFCTFLFVAIPAPGTGAWTGCLIATLLQMRLRRRSGPLWWASRPPD